MCGRVGKHTFSKEWEVDLEDLAVETKDGFEMRLCDIACEVCDDDDFCVRLCVEFFWIWSVNVHVGRREGQSWPASTKLTAPCHTFVTHFLK